jgi:hypothetical protein
LLNADFREALNNCHLYEKTEKPLSAYTSRRTQSNISKPINVSSTVNEVFPIPSSLQQPMLNIQSMNGSQNIQMTFISTKTTSAADTKIVRRPMTAYKASS